MRSIFIMALKDLALVARDKMGMFFIIAFPVLMGVFFGTMYGGMGGEGSGDMEIAVVDEDGSAMSAKFVAALDDAAHVHVARLSRDAAMDGVRRGRISGMIAIPKGFGETAGVPWLAGPALEVGVDPSRKAEAGMLQGLVMQSAGTLMGDRFSDALRAVKKFFGQKDDDQSSAAETAGGESKTPAPSFQLAGIKMLDVTHQAAPGSHEELVSRVQTKWDISFPQAMMWGVLGCAATFAITMVRERKQGTLLRLQAAPVSRSQVLLGKALACFLTVLAVIAMMVALGMWLGMRPRSPALLVLAAICVAWCFVGIMMLMSVIGRTEEAVSGAAWGLNSLMAMFGGGMIPLVFMPKFMVSLSAASPVKWSILAVEGAVWRGFTLSEMLGPCAVLLAIGAGCLTLGAVRLSRMAD
jgi:ABC-2 type transport system permease protein